MDQEKIGKFISLNRKKQNLTQEDLANKLNVSINAVSKWERGISLPDVSIMKDLCHILNISLNELFSGEYIKKEDLVKRSEENILENIKYTNKIEEKNKIIGFILLIIGLLLIISSMVIFPSESSFSFIGSFIGLIISIVGLLIILKKKRLIIIYIILLSVFLIILDFVSSYYIKEAPRLALKKIYAKDTIYYDTPFYDVIRCHRDQKNEFYIFTKNIRYDQNNISKYCHK